MKAKLLVPAILLLGVATLTGCTKTNPPITGFVISIPVGEIDPNNLGSKKGESCSSFMSSPGLVEAAKKGNIRKIKYVETEIRPMAGFCTVVYGD